MDIWFAIISYLRGLLDEVCGHCPLTLLAEMEEHTDGDRRRKRPKVKLPAPMLVVSYSPLTLHLLKAKGLGLCWRTMIATSL